MFPPYLITAFVVLGSIFLYIYYIGPKLNPMNRANNYLRQNMVSEAIIELKRILENKPDNYVVHHKLGELYFKMDKVDKGVHHFEEIIKINKYNYEVDKVEVLRKLARAYLKRGESTKAFNAYYEISRLHPIDQEALYHVSFMTLGQEYFDFAAKKFETLVRNLTKKSFEVYFGAGIAHYLSQNYSGAVEYFKDALALDPDSDIANLAIAFALQYKKDFGEALGYLEKIMNNSEDDNATFIAKRLYGIIAVQARRPIDALNVYRELYETAKQDNDDDEIMMLLYDMGFCAFNAEKLESAYEYWNELYEINKSYKNTQLLVTILRKEMDTEFKEKKEENFESRINDYIKEWLEEAFPERYIWRICGLRSSEEIDMSILSSSSRSGTGRIIDGFSGDDGSDYEEMVDRFVGMDKENFRLVSGRIIERLGYRIGEMLNTYREADGVDFTAVSVEDKKKALVWVRRWQDTKVGEIPLRNFAQAINDAKAKAGVFISTVELTSSAEKSLENLSKVNVVYPDELGRILAEIL